ncbi:hypothetical protein HMPREF1230_0872 [Streptococcus pyogenes GA19681]|nr:hypothetical protein HMPREF1230_0872 [Streptococcus pyogenes GA19681]ESA46939.1 hypothetical protein HMPREF1234_1918 [Streptococcus pyogenes GA41039]ESA49807.1 hypothetical protein HMPREF1232_1748 [Streptococcus pyogenes GA40468]ESA50364.1 hypothetical protein HMPREF1233_1587 [Streptococcus pyogenes GA19700]BAR43908.1 hypothetical protein SPYJRS4_0408 [Streptococcus pyogenes JRS4]
MTNTTLATIKSFRSMIVDAAYGFVIGAKLFCGVSVFVD